MDAHFDASSQSNTSSPKPKAISHEHIKRGRRGAASRLQLIITSELLLRLYGLDEPLQRIERYAGGYPVTYVAEG
jgi:hypothetical protein